MPAEWPACLLPPPRHAGHEVQHTVLGLTVTHAEAQDQLQLAAVLAIVHTRTCECTLASLFAASLVRAAHAEPTTAISATRLVYLDTGLTPALALLQAVWRASVQIGCAQASCSAVRMLFACVTDPPGNLLNPEDPSYALFRANILPATADLD